MIDIRPAASGDRDAVLALADRLTVGVAGWRSPDLVLDAVRGWVSSDLERLDDGATDRAVYVAVEGNEVAGFIAVNGNAHWSGEVDAYIGELVVRPDRERRGIGRKLVRAAEGWAAARGLRRIRLATGAANVGALQLYARLGYEIEDVTVSKSVVAREDPAGSSAPD